MALTIVIPTIGRPQQFAAALESIALVDAVENVIVVHQGDRGGYEIPDWFDGRWIWSDRIGLSAGRNEALRYVDTRSVLFLDDDAVALPALADVCREHEDSGRAVTSATVGFVGADGSIVRDLGPTRRRVLRPWHLPTAFLEPAAIWSTHLLREIGGFDERLGVGTYLGAEEGPAALARIHRLAPGEPMVSDPTRIIRHPEVRRPPTSKVRSYGRGLGGLLVLYAREPWVLSYVATVLFRDVGATLVDVARFRRTRVHDRLARFGGIGEGAIHALKTLGSHARR